MNIDYFSDFVSGNSAGLSGAIDALSTWKRSTYQCSAESHAYLYVLFACWFLLTIGGVYLYFRVTKPARQAQASRSTTETGSIMNNGNQTRVAPSAIKKHLHTVVVLVLMLTGRVAFAQSSSTDELGGGICQVVNLLTGKFLFGIAVLSMLGGGGALLFGAEMSDGVKKMVTIVAIVGMIVSFGSILSLAFTAMKSSGC